MRKSNTKIIIKADKGLAVVITDDQGYVKEAEYKLNNNDSYKNLQHDLIQTHTQD